jgi:hypothetical protein
VDPFRQLQALSLLAMALLFAPWALPPLRRHAWRLQLAALVLYLVGGVVIFAAWQLGG